MLQNYTPQETGIFVIVSRKIANNKWVKRQLMTFYHVREARPSRLGNRIFSVKSLGYQQKWLFMRLLSVFSVTV